MADIKPFKINILDSELDLLQQKLKLTRLPSNISGQKWSEDNGVTLDLMAFTIDFWRTNYDWRAEEAKLNQLLQFQAPIEIPGFGTQTLHFIHSRSSSASAIPLFFQHGWPGSVFEVRKILPLLNDAGFHVVAPSLFGYGFSSYPDEPGFKYHHQGDAMHKLMLKLGYDRYVVQGGDWGSWITRYMAYTYPSHIKALHVNMFYMRPQSFSPPEPQYSPLEKACLSRIKWFETTGFAYGNIHQHNPLTLSFSLHDSPLGMLAWMTDKLLNWSDAYPWTPTELITWTLLHYFPGPATAIQIYRESHPELLAEGFSAERKVEVPTGISVFPKEITAVPRSWAVREANVVGYWEHERGGHFAAWERPEDLVGDIVPFFRGLWKGDVGVGWDVRIGGEK